jgi:hypothetical protein
VVRDGTREKSLAGAGRSVQKNTLKESVRDKSSGEKKIIDTSEVP